VGSRGGKEKDGGRGASNPLAFPLLNEAL